MYAWVVVSSCVTSCWSVTVDSDLLVVVSPCSVVIAISVTEKSVVDILRTGVVETGGWVGVVVFIEDSVLVETKVVDLVASVCSLVVEVNSSFSSVVYLTVDVEVVLV